MLGECSPARPRRRAPGGGESVSGAARALGAVLAEAPVPACRDGAADGRGVRDRSGRFPGSRAWYCDSSPRCCRCCPGLARRPIRCCAPARLPVHQLEYSSHAAATTVAAAVDAAGSRGTKAQGCVTRCCVAPAERPTRSRGRSRPGATPRAPRLTGRGTPFCLPAELEANTHGTTSIHPWCAAVDLGRSPARPIGGIGGGRPAGGVVPESPRRDTGTCRSGHADARVRIRPRLGAGLERQLAEHPLAPRVGERVLDACAAPAARAARC